MMHEYQHLITLSRSYLSDAYRERFEQGVGLISAENRMKQPG